MDELDMDLIRYECPKLYLEMVRNNGDIYIQTNKRRRALCVLYMELADINNTTSISNLRDRTDPYEIADIHKFEIYDIAATIIGIINSDESQVDSKCNDCINICNNLSDSTEIEVLAIYKIFDQIKYIPGKLARCYNNIEKSRSDMNILENSMRYYQNIINDSNEYETITIGTLKSRLSSLNLVNYMKIILSEVKPLEKVSSNTTDVDLLTAWKDAYCMYVYLVDHAIHEIVEYYFDTLSDVNDEGGSIYG